MKTKSPHPLHHSIHSRLRAFHLKRLMPKNKKGKFLDVGCGLGYLSELLGEGCFRVGVESDDSSIKFNKEKGLINMIKGDASRLPFQKESFDIIVCSEVLEHLPDKVDEKTLIELFNLLKPGGLLYITVPSLEGLRAHTELRNLGHDDASGGEYHYRIGYKWDNIKRLINTIPSAKIKKRRYSMFLFSELIMDLQKLVFFKQNKFKEQSDIVGVKQTPIFRIYKFLLPLLLILFFLEDMLLATFFKGHILIFVIEKGNDK